MDAIGTQLRDPINSGLTRWRMAVLYKLMDAAAELGRTRFSLSMENEQADAGRYCRIRLARPNSQARTRDRGILIFPAQLTTSRVGNLTRLIHTLLYVCVCVCVCFLPIHSGHQVRWTYQPGSHRRKVAQDFSSIFFLRCVP